MVVCKCRKATKLYCFIHKVPICGECICFPEHQLCVVRTYSEWVTDGSMIGLRNAGIAKLCLKREQTLKLHDWVVCIWPPKSVKDSGSCLHSKLKEVIMQIGLDKNLFGNHPVSLGTETRSPPHLPRNH
ncbi:hypothetical protein CASFOL_036425 [Castilleja foliolosa]|uniref:Uncharacterized protein n=1 Tax=Castilleja foliolosa TaxID=1961234 RepID=A0ABD3BWE8_9LAMI